MIRVHSIMTTIAVMMVAVVAESYIHETSDVKASMFILLVDVRTDKMKSIRIRGAKENCEWDEELSSRIMLNMLHARLLIAEHSQQNGNRNSTRTT